MHLKSPSIYRVLKFCLGSVKSMLHYDDNKVSLLSSYSIMRH